MWDGILAHGHRNSIRLPVTLIILSEDKVLYFEALEQTRQQQDHEIFRKFMFEESLKIFRNAIDMMNRKQVLKESKGKGLSFLF